MDSSPDHFLCPISKELMRDPVTIFSGVTYDRKSIEKWFFTYKKKTCPATMQQVSDFSITPNHTLKRLILSWQNANTITTMSSSSSSDPSSSSKCGEEEMADLLNAVDSSPFKVTSLKKLRSVVDFMLQLSSAFTQV